MLTSACHFATTQAKGSTDMLALHEFVVKVTVFLKAVGNRAELSTKVADLFAEYAGALAEQGLFVTAAKYCRYVVRLLHVFSASVRISFWYSY